MEIKFERNERNHQAFDLYENGEKKGEMEVGIHNNLLTVYHTEVFAGGEGKGWAKLLLDAMIAHARENNLKVVPLCPYVLAQFKRHPELYEDVWSKDQ